MFTVENGKMNNFMVMSLTKIGNPDDHEIETETGYVTDHQWKRMYTVLHM